MSLRERKKAYKEWRPQEKPMKVESHTRRSTESSYTDSMKTTHPRKHNQYR